MNKKILLLALSALAFIGTRLAQAQPQGKVPRIGFVSSARIPSNFYHVFREGLRELGYVEGKNILLELKSGDSRSRLMALAIDLVQQKVDVIVAPGGTIGSVAKAIGTMPVPIVFSYSGDPVEAGLVRSIAQPGGNMTGITWLAFELVGKRLELLKEAGPRISRVAVLADPKHPGEQRELQETQSTARQLGLNLTYHQLTATDNLDAVLSAVIRQRANALIVFPDSVTLEHRNRIAEFAIKQQLPSIYGWKEYTEAGGLMSYGPDREETLRRVAVYVDKILKGRQPADLPVEQPTKFELVINLKTAKQIGLTIPPNVLARADRVIR